MDSSVLRRLAFHALRLAELCKDSDEASKLRLTAADYFEKAEQLSADEQQTVIATEKRPEA